MDKDTEREIAKGLQEGDRWAWLQLYEGYIYEFQTSSWQRVSFLLESPLEYGAMGAGECEMAPLLTNQLEFESKRVLRKNNE